MTSLRTLPSMTDTHSISKPPSRRDDTMLARPKIRARQGEGRRERREEEERGGKLMI